MFLKIKKIPKVNWSSNKPYNFKPKFSTFFFLCFGLMLFGLGEGLGPRDGLMIGLQKVTNLPVAAVRAILEISVVSIGWYLGGTVGVGTLLFAFGIGPCVALGLFMVDKLFD